jgi:membrane-associated phospholipid phosphatase
MLRKSIIAKFWNKYNDKIMFVLFLIQLLVGYNLIQRYFSVGRTLTIPFIDNNIPFIPAFVLAYLCYAIIIILPFALTFRNKKQFLAISTAFFFVATIGNICYIFFQTTIIRPEIIPNNITNKLILFIYSVDKPVNLFPSLHVALPVLTTLCLSQIRKKSVYILAPITVLIILSTLFIRQHHILDVVSGLLVAFIGYKFIFKKIMNSKNITKRNRKTKKSRKQNI